MELLKAPKPSDWLDYSNGKILSIKAKSSQSEGCRRQVDFHFSIAGNVQLSLFEVRMGQLNPESFDWDSDRIHVKTCEMRFKGFAT